ncbi:ion channel [Chitinophaga sp. sic0106]|uniref:ion channel n=1 Tax=Chitinophaga sp. sic0106 TaxID=2854785 RepID=UPI001C449381|nr:ion channel [Chitinophaga sp. sic0106]MBV7532055.1 transporter [Chitinophaga sp. sic0106]
MALLKRINPFSKTNEDTGLGANAAGYGGRFINRDGSFNLRREGNDFLHRYSIYHALLNVPVWHFVSFLLLFYFGVNLFYTGLYWLIGPEQLQGVIGTTTWQRFKELYFFSTETFTTVGYGRVNPIGDGANFVASIEAMTGFLSFAIVTGLLYGRFSRPRAHLLFSDTALIAPYRGKTGLMFRLVSHKDYHVLTDVVIQVNLSILVEENGEQLYKYYDLPLERKRVDSLSMNWTVVHPIDEASPLLGLSAADMKSADVELYVLVRGFNDVYSNMVQQRTSYTFEEIEFNRKFIPMYRMSKNGDYTILDLHKLSATEAADSQA